MQFITAILLVICLQAGAFSLQAQDITISGENLTLKEIFTSIKKQTGYNFIYSNEDINRASRVTIHAEKEPLREVLNKTFYHQPFSYSIYKGVIIISPKTSSLQSASVEEKQQIDLGKIGGMVKDSVTGEPLVGVSIRVKGSTIGTATDADGKFELEVPEGAVLEISYLGYEPQQITVGKKKQLIISLSATSKGLEQIVVVGYGKQKKISVTGAISTVGSRELKESPTANISNMLVGRLPGLLATQASGAPGNNQSTLRIRGISTFSGSQEPLVLVDGVQEPNFNNIDPNEVESISILKDASATAVYGVRGANGVILITTKKGKVGKPQISFTSNFALKSFTDLRQDLNSYDYARLYNEALKYDSYATGNYDPRFTDEDIELYRTGADPILHPNTDWYNIIFKPFSTQTHHNLSIRGGTQKTKYFISGSYFLENGNFNDDAILPKDYINLAPQIVYKRYNFRSNLDFDITKNLQATISVSARIENRREPTNRVSNVIQSIYVNPPLSAPSPALTGGKVVNLPGVVNLDNPYSNPMVIWLTGIGNKGGPKKVNRSFLDGLVRLNYDLSSVVKGLSATGSLSYKNYSNFTYQLHKPMVLYNAVRLNDSSIGYVPLNDAESPVSTTTTTGKKRHVYTEFKINYDRTFGDHQVTGMILYNQGKDIDPTLAFGIPHAYQGVVGRVTYNYQNRYMAEFNAGYNGTENFAVGKRFGFFPAYSAGWVVSEEPFFPHNDYVTFIKLRGSYGVVGNDKIGGDRFLYLPSSYYFDNVYYFGEAGSNYHSVDMSHEGKIGNPDLTWEKAKKTDIGIDLHLFRDKIEITADWFYEKRNDILTNLASAPSLVGANLPTFNIGRMQNSGVDGSITFNDGVGNFNYWAKVDYTFARNKILFMDEVPHQYAYQNLTGLPYGQYIGYVAEGFYNTWEDVIDANRPKTIYNLNRLMPGDIKYKDVNGDGEIDEDDQVPIGYPSFPGQFYSFSVGADYKGFYFSVLIQGAADYSHKPSPSFISGWHNDNSTPEVWKDLSWTQERYEQGLPIKLHRISVGNDLTNNIRLSTQTLENSNYCRIKNLEIGYNFSHLLLQNIGVNSARIYLNGNNLYTWDKLFPGEDPATPSYGAANYEPYPITKTYNVGIELTLK